MRSICHISRFRLLIILPLVAGLVGGQAEAANCLAALDLEEGAQSYSCDFKSDTGEMLEGGLVFDQMEGLDQDFFTVSMSFDLDGEPADGIAPVGYCTCKTRASVRAAQFGAARSFSCVTPMGEDAAELLEGKLTGNGKKIKKGQSLSVLPPSEGTGTDGFLRLRFDCKSGGVVEE